MHDFSSIEDRMKYFGKLFEKLQVYCDSEEDKKAVSEFIHHTMEFHRGIINMYYEIDSLVCDTPLDDKEIARVLIYVMSEIDHLEYHMKEIKGGPLQAIDNISQVLDPDEEDTEED